VITDKEKIRLMKGVEYGKNYAIANLYATKESNLFIFEEMKKKGWELISISWTDAVFKKTEVKE